MTTRDVRETTRRAFLDFLAGGAGAIVLSPIAVGCATGPSVSPAATAHDDPLAIPRERPPSWDPVAFNRARGNAGAIPESYRAQINGPDGELKHLGKHLPYTPPGADAGVPAGMIALMWGDPSKGYAAHPNAPRSAATPDGHWYSWIRVRKAAAGYAEEKESRYSAWPVSAPGDTGAYRAASGADPSADSGKNTIYLAQLPADVRPGDLVRVHAHCLTHGEYVDFVTVRGAKRAAT